MPDSLTVPLAATAGLRYKARPSQASWRWRRNRMGRCEKLILPLRAPATQMQDQQAIAMLRSSAKMTLLLLQNPQQHLCQLHATLGA